MNRNKKRKIWIIPVVTVATALALVVCWKTDVFGKFIPQEPYVEGEPELMNAGENAVVVTNEGGNRQGEEGSGAEPCSEEVPTCVGKKGSKTNPFVILEIVANHCDQQLPYLAAEDDSQEPLDIMKIGIDVAKEKMQFYKPESSAPMKAVDLGESMGKWFAEYQYDVHKVGKVDKKEELPFVNIDKLYSFQITDDDIINAGYSEEEFAKHYTELGNNTISGVKSFVEEYYPKLFEKDESGKTIRDIALEDNDNWYVQKVDRGDIQHNVTFTSDDLVRDNGYKNYVNKYEILQENPNVFLHDSSGNKISVSARNDVDNWTGECTKTVSYDYTVVTPNIAEEDYNDYLNGKIQMKDLIGKYSNLFEKDKDGKAIEKSRLGVNGWELKKEEEEFPETLNSGYVHYVGNGGEYSCELNWNPTRHELREKKGGEWEYLEKLPDGAKEANASDYWNGKFQNTEYYWSVSELKKAFQNSEVVKIEKRGIYNFAYKNDISHYKFSYNGKQKDYSFEYWGLRNNNILKRQLFQFKTQKEYDDFHMKVITMTPSELNEIADKDDNNKLDLIERADMFYVGCYQYNSTINIDKVVHDLYYSYTEKGKKEQKDDSKLKSFEEDDLDWKLCYKMIYRLCHNKNLPLMLTQGLGDIVNKGTASVPMYFESAQNQAHASTLCNLAKLYIIGTEFDLTAKKADDEKYISTFYDDILSSGKLWNISLAPTSVSDEAFKSENPAKNTGYYKRPKLAVGVEQSESEKCYYLWNMLTFLPPDLEARLMQEGYLKSGQIAIPYESEEKYKEELEKLKDIFEAYGYMRTFLDVQTTSKVLWGEQAMHQNGSDGTIGNVAIPHDPNGDSHYSSLLGATEKGGNTNAAISAAFTILNKRPEVINPQIVKLMKQKKEYVKMSDTDALVDHSSEQTYQEDEKSYIKVLIHNNNNGEAGVVTKVTLVNEQGQPAPTDSELKLYTAKDYLKECEKAKYGIYEGYNIPDGETVIAYVPYSLKQWANGYNIVEFETVGRIYSEKKKTIIFGKPIKTNINISERTLFNLD